MMWAKFKALLRKNLGNDRAFANSIPSKFRRDSQYQAECVLQWTAHLERLQSIFLEYNPVGAPTKPIMLRYFQEGVKHSVLAELEHWDFELESFDQMVKKAVDTQAKLAHWLCSSTKEIDQNCPWGNQPANSTVAKSQGSTMIDSRSAEPKFWGKKSLSGSQQSESSEKAWKQKKKKQRQKDWKRQKNSTPATGVNAPLTSELYQKKKYQDCLDRASRDTSQIKCYNSQKLGHYANKYPE